MKMIDFYYNISYITSIPILNPKPYKASFQCKLCVCV